MFNTFCPRIVTFSSKQRVIANLGRKDLLAPHLESLIELLGGGKKTVDVMERGSWLIGNSRVAYG
jgi:hypothetical protein